jgi:hypothetical protein
MGIIVGSKTKLECDGTDCDKTSKPHFDQREATQSADSAGWIKNSTTGKTYCPSCKFSQN